MEEYKRQLSKSFHPFGAIGRKIKALPKEEIENCFIDIPEDWSISEADQLKAKEFLYFQISHVDDIIRELEVDFKFKRGEE